MCGGSIRETNKFGVCRRNPACAKEQTRLSNAAYYEATHVTKAQGVCRICSGPMRSDSKYGICRRTPECKKAKHNAYFEDNKEDLLARQAQWYKDNAERLRPKQAEYRKNNPEKVADSKRRSQYGLKLGEYEAMLASQDDRCRGCGRNGVKLHLDHDHSCCPKLPTCGKCNRGLLCDWCNRGIGFLQDDPATLRALASYLEAWENRNA